MRPFSLKRLLPFSLLAVLLLSVPARADERQGQHDDGLWPSDHAGVVGTLELR